MYAPNVATRVKVTSTCSPMPVDRFETVSARAYVPFFAMAHSMAMLSRNTGIANRRSVRSSIGRSRRGIVHDPRLKNRARGGRGDGKEPMRFEAAHEARDARAAL